MKKITTIFFIVTLVGMSACINVIAQEEVSGNFKFNLQATVFDYGEAIDKVSFSIDSLENVGEVDIASIDNDTFKIKATATNPYTLPDEVPQYGLYQDVERTIKNISLASDSKTILIDLETKYDQTGQGTLNYVGGDVARNLSMDITYTMEQTKDFNLKDGTVIKADSTYTMGDIRSPEVEKFTPDTYIGKGSTINYQEYKPENANDGNKHPLIIWFHGNGEGGYNGIQNNNSQLRANRGAVAFVSEEAQSIFGGAYVLAPQVSDTWYNNYANNYIDTMTALINEYSDNHNIDTNRIYVYGCSAGGYMTTRMAIDNPMLFAAVVPICAAVDKAPNRGVETTEAQIKTLVNNNIWFVHSADDTTVNPETSSQWMHALLPNSIYTEYDTVTIEGTSYPGHWSWIYVGRNMPMNEAGESIWEWTANQKLETNVEIPESENKPEVPDKMVVKTSDYTNIINYSIGCLLSVTMLTGLIKQRKKQ